MGFSIRHTILMLWNGQLSLGRAFWLYAMLYGTVANLLTTIVSLAMLSRGTPAPIAALIHFLPLPYNIVAGIGVWRSAGRYPGNPLWATLARIAVLIWAVAATLA